MKKIILLSPYLATLLVVWMRQHRLNSYTFILYNDTESNLN